MTKKKNRRIRKDISQQINDCLDAFRAGATTKEACRAAGMGTGRTGKYYSLLENDPEFARQVTKAIEEGDKKRTSDMKDVLTQCWRNASVNPQYQASLFFALKAADPTRYCEKYQRLNSDFDYQEFIQRILKHDTDEPTSSNSGGDA